MSNAAKPSKTQAANATTLPLLLEIGCEEIPARFLAQAQKDFGDRLKVALEESRLIPKEEKFVALSQRERVSVGRRTGEGAHQDQYQLQTYSTPRRLA
ncbi:MAG TPA: glycine--tRNA ligase subunit beta, partial [Terriglobia bacterium]|nr:glycine--tRNA ligase subunit beta [Terriglobia bacterium]